MNDKLFTRDGAEYTGSFHSDDKGKPYFTRQERCSRCGGTGGAQQWAYTGWTCYQCGGSGKGETVTFKATIIGHEEYRNEKQTLVERPKLQ